MKLTLFCAGLVAIPSTVAYLDARSSVLTLATFLGPAPVAAYAIPSFAHVFAREKKEKRDNTTDSVHHHHNGTHDECHSNSTRALIDAVSVNGTCHHHHHN